MSVLRLPDASSSNTEYSSRKTQKNQLKTQDLDLGVFGEMMISMLPQDLPFTVFIPSQTAFRRDLRLSVHASMDLATGNNTYAIVSRVLSFSCVPRILSSATVPSGRVLSYDSLSGLILQIWKDEDGVFTVNRVRSEQVDIKKGMIVVHVMDGVVMDADFEQSVQATDDDEEE